MMNSRRELCAAAALAAVLLGPLTGCSKKDRSVPPGPPGLPASSAGAGAGANSDRVHPPTAAMPADHAQALRGRSEGPEPTAILRGSLNLADSVKAKVPAGGTIFLIARALLPGGGPGPVLAAKRLTVGAWPQPFELSASDVMISGMSLSGKVVLGARVDQDGDAMTKQPGDVEGISTPVEVPASGVVVLLDKLRTEAAGAPSPPGMGGPAGGGAGMGGSLPAGHPAVGADPSGAAAPALPAGHPSIGAEPSGAAAPAMPAGHPTVAPGSTGAAAPARPAGHPPAAGKPPGQPHGQP